MVISLVWKWTDPQKKLHQLNFIPPHSLRGGIWVGCATSTLRKLHPTDHLHLQRIEAKTAFLQLRLPRSESLDGMEFGGGTSAKCTAGRIPIFFPQPKRVGKPTPKPRVKVG